MKVLIIIPAYNEQESINAVVENLKTNFPSYDYVVVNDCSTDATRFILKSSKYNFLDLPSNLGIGGGMQAGYIYAAENNYDVAIQIDGDGQHDPQFIPEMLKLIENGEADMVIGSRFVHETAGFKSTAMRRLGIQVLHFLIKMVSSANVYDATSGFRASNKALTAFYAKNYAHDYPEPEAIVAASLNGFKVKEYPVEMKERQGGVSSISGFKSLYYMIKVSLAILVCRLIYTGKKR